MTGKLMVITIAAVIGMLASTAVMAQAPDNPWLLLGLRIDMGQTITIPGPEAVAGVNPLTKEGYRTFSTNAACEIALARVIKRYVGKSHAEGAYGRYLCTNWQTWQHQ